MAEEDKNASTGPSAASARAVWERIARWWDAAIDEGNEFQRLLIMPATDRLLDLVPGETVLDIACGNGNYARRLGRAGAKVVAFDGSATFIELARNRTTPDDGDIAYHVVDATDEAAMVTLGEDRFDAAVCSMAVMDFPELGPLLRAVRTLLKPGGRFVFSLPHPCFNSASIRLTAEMTEKDGAFSQVFGVHVLDYLTPTARLSSGIINQPEPHYLVHRPLAALLSECFAAGFVMDAMEEPRYPTGTGARTSSPGPNVPVFPQPWLSG